MNDTCEYPLKIAEKRHQVWKYFLVVLSAWPPVFTAGQKNDSLEIVINTTATTAAKSYQPLWLTANRFNSISEQKTDLAVAVSIWNQVPLNFLHWHLTDSSGPRYPILSYGLGIENNNHFKTFFLQEYFVKIGRKRWLISAGRYRETTGANDADLSTGSLGISSNALPVPKISVGSNNYVDVPFSNGWVQLKVQIAHGWFGANRYTKNSLLHEKLLYIRLGKKRFRFFGGLQHFVEWAGSREGREYDHSWENFFNVFLGKELKGDGAPQNTALLPNREGDQRAVVEWGFDYDLPHFLVHFYHQTPLENAQGIHLLNNRLAGVGIQPKEAVWLKRMVFEFISTVQTDDNYPALYRQSFYNNGVYRSGWDYHDRIIGTPLFINRQRASKYFPGVPPFNPDAAPDSLSSLNNIYINNVVGGHIGVMLGNNNLNTRTLVTYTRNHNLVNGRSYNQWYTLQEVSYRLLKQRLTATVAIAFDAGELTKNIGLLAGIEWHFANNTRIR
ncbi:MAG: capsule assembly Wzi family protein [Chitinophagaceae bacterium]